MHNFLIALGLWLFASGALALDAAAVNKLGFGDGDEKIAAIAALVAEGDLEAIFSSPSPKPSLLTVAASSANALDATSHSNPVRSMRIYEEGAARGGPFIVAKSRRYLVMIVLPSGSPFFLSLPAMNGLHGWALIGPLVFQTTLNWPFACTSPMNTALCR